MKQSIQKLIEQEPVFKKIVAQYGMPTIPSRPQGFETLVLLILEQQVSIDSAKATHLKLKAKVPVFLPQNFINMSEDDFRTAGVSRQKSGYIKALSSSVFYQEIDLESLAHKSAIQVREELIQIKGIGHWTIDIYLMFCLQEPDLMPLGDIAVVNTLKELFDIHDKATMEIFILKWSPYRSAATFLLWHHYLKKRNRKVTY